MLYLYLSIKGDSLYSVLSLTLKEKSEKRTNVSGHGQ